MVLWIQYVFEGSCFYGFEWFFRNVSGLLWFPVVLVGSGGFDGVQWFQMDLGGFD